MKKIVQARQGDVLIEFVSKKRPAKAITLKKDEQGIVLALGEVTGHCHMVCESDVELIEVNGEKLMFSENGFRVVHGNLSAMGLSDPTKIDEATLLTEYQMPGQDHFTIGFPGGTVRHIQQKEYAPEAIRNVAD